jgi:predicted ATPase/DNA-binding winged helix-turn-helix (wHTH) protein
MGDSKHWVLMTRDVKSETGDARAENQWRLRQWETAMSTGYRFENVELRPEQRQLLVGGKQSRIGARAFDLLLTLVEQRDRVVGKNELIDRVWPGVVVEENNLQVHISSLRKVLGPQAIATVPGRGYRFTAELADESGSREESRTSTSAMPAGYDAQPNLPTNLPHENPTLFGRETELRQLRSLLELNRLVTISGGGGIGKTALAQALAYQSRERFHDGVWRVELAPVASASLVVSAIANVLQITPGTHAPVEALARALRASRTLILLDNCEHVTEAVAEISLAFFRTAPGVKILATSQEPLKLTHERVYRLGPLEFPALDSQGDARQAGAVALFEARAVAADPRFTLGDHNIAAVAEICRHLDGIPLAIELAAARLPLLGVEGLCARLVERFRVLRGGTRDALPRHQTLRAAMEWSHGLLTPGEQTVLRRLAVFAGGFRLEAAQHVARDAQLDDWAVLEHVSALVDKSLVVAQDGAQPRYKLLETTRAFAREMLLSSGELSAMRRRHCEAVLAIYEPSLEAELLVPRYDLLGMFMPDLDNARAALDWAAGPEGDAVLQVALAGAISWLWDPAGLHHEGMRRTREARLRIDAATPPQLEARLEAAWCCVAWPQVGAEELQANGRAIELFRALGDSIGLYRALCQHGKRLGVMGRFDEADQVLQEAQALFDPEWPRPLYAVQLTARGCNLLERGDAEGSKAIYEERYELARELGDDWLMLASLVNIEQGHALLGQWEESARRGYEMLEMLRNNRTLRQSNEIYVVGNLCMALAELGRLDEGMEMARRSLVLHLQWGDMLCMIDQTARLTFKRGHVRDAARMLGHVEATYARTGRFRQMVEMRLRDALLADLQATLPAAELARLMKEGASISDESAAALALRD